MKSKNYLEFKIDLATCWQIMFVFCMVAILMVLPSAEVLASSSTTTTSDGVSDVLCRIANQLSGPIGKGISTIAICVIGIGLFMGKLSWALALATGLGIGLIFSAGKVVTWLSADTTTAGCSSMT